MRRHPPQQQIQLENIKSEKYKRNEKKEKKIVFFTLNHVFRAWRLVSPQHETRQVKSQFK